MTDFTRILSAIEQGDASATEKLLPLVYDQLRRAANFGLRRVLADDPQVTDVVRDRAAQLRQGR